MLTWRRTSVEASGMPSPNAIAWKMATSRSSANGLPPVKSARCLFVDDDCWERFVGLLLGLRLLPFLPFCGAFSSMRTK